MNTTSQTAEGSECDSYYNSTNNETLDYINLWAYINCVQGPQRQPLSTIIPITIINIAIFVTGFLGNLAVCIVIIRHSTLHTATNYYLFNLAVSDLMLLIFGLPNDVAIYWHTYPWTLGQMFCQFRALLSEMASYVSVLTIVAFSTERYLAICYPLYLHKMSGFQRAVRIITGLWIIGFFAALPFVLCTTVNYINYPYTDTIIEESAFCGMLSLPTWFPLCEFSTITFFIIPLFVIGVQYVKMGLKISQTTKKSLGKEVKGSVHRTNRRLQANKKVIRMLSLVVIGFFFSWAPFHAQRLIFIYLKENPHYEEINSWMYIITGLFYYFSSTLNPIVYNIMSNRMRNAFKEIICRIKPQSSPNTNSTLVRELTTHQPNNYPNEDDTEHLVKRDMIINTQIKNKMICEINIKNGSSIYKSNLETRI